MNELSRRLDGLADAAARAAGDAPVGEVLRRARRRRVVRRTVPAVAGVAVVAAAALLVPPAVQLWRDGATPASGTACGRPVETAAGEAFDGAEVLGEDGPVAVGAGANATVESGDDLAVGVGVSYAASGVDSYELVPDADGSYAAIWLVDDDGLVVGVAVPDTVGQLETTSVTPEADVWIDGAYQLWGCDGESLAGAVPTGEYELVAAVAARPGNVEDPAPSVVLSAPAGLRVGTADPLENLGACGSQWPAGVEATTDGYELGLRVTAPADLGDAVPFDPDADPPGEGLEFPVTVRNDSGAELVGWTGHPWLVVVRDGIVVGVPGASDDVGIDATMTPRAELELGAWMPLHDCATMGQDPETGLGEPLPPGEYEVYAISHFFFTEPAGTEGPEGDRTDVTAVGGPWLVTVP
ncbi:hypothetical protein Bcav_2965 [Beutenbergia cavernae DSM 12333]|uniref:Uncharacterized protein n=1 Tax=Beutenbergia cavernae (strain ATCC BAA-8 / DSM 12333 / CCUG 43141 / JCM 11478 / NBRC 16432 / NCIMB 13614 / HKI 0122) TaxID=471853 RepID=C5BZ95_BEUC1|nr:hypothetical protein [Beutenbergia cavernae]ACQ81210.1 hypothetical protein Bcav_2965 [Beutenbergia cavernae DSM 12333]